MVLRVNVGYFDDSFCGLLNENKLFIGLIFFDILQNFSAGLIGLFLLGSVAFRLLCELMSYETQ